MHSLDTNLSLSHWDPPVDSPPFSLFEDMANRSMKRKYKDARDYVKLRWTASKRKTKRKLTSAKTKTKQVKVEIQDKWTTLVVQPRSSLKLTSPVPHLLTCNEAPSDEQEQLVHTALESAEHERKKYKAEMERRAVWELLKSKTQPRLPELTHIDKYVDELKGVVSPLRRLPTELLQEIFLAGSNEMRTYFPTSYRPSGATDWPWTLAQVCRRWRDVCLKTPDLWNYLPVLQMKSRQLPGEKRRERDRYALMLERSGDAPLHVSISGFGVDLVTHPIIEMLVAVSERWETAILDMTLMTFPTLNPVKGKLARLKSLRLWLWYSFIPPTLPIKWDMFSDAPALQNVDLYSTSFSEELVLPYHQLKYLFVDSSSLTFLDLPCAVKSFITNTTPLQSLSLNMSFDAPFSSPIIFPDLKRLKLTFYGTRAPTTLDSLTLPALEELIVACESDVILSIILSLIRRSSTASGTALFPLKKLHLQMDTASSDVLIPMVDLLPCLNTLEVPLTMDSVEFVQRLGAEDVEGVIAPDLEYCNFRVKSFCFPSLYEALDRLARRRCCGFEDTGGGVGGEGAGLGGGSDAASEETIPILRMFKRVKALSLHCKQFPSLIRHQRMLEESSWTEKSSRGMLDDVPSTLGQLAENISRVVSETSGYGIGSPYGAHVVGRLGKEQALGVIRELKRCRVEDVDVRDIYIPQVHLQLQALEKWIESDMTKVKWKGAAGILKELQTAIKETLEKWYFALDEYSPQIHWVVISHTVLMYVPPDDPFRSTSDSIDLARVHDASSYLNPFHEAFSKGVCSDDL